MSQQVKIFGKTYTLDSLRAPTTQEPAGLSAFNTVVENAAAASIDSKSPAPLNILIESLKSAAAALILVAGKRLEKVESLLQPVDKYVQTMNAAFAASERPTNGGVFQIIAKKAAVTEKTYLVNSLVATNIKAMESAKSLLAESESDYNVMSGMRNQQPRYDSSVIDSLKKVAISAYWKKCEVDSQISTLNSNLDIVEQNLVKIPELIYEGLLIENELNGDKSILSKSVGASINAQLENDKKAAKASEDKQLFDMYMNFCNQSELGWYLAKALNCAYSSGLILQPPQTYQNISFGGRAPSPELMAKKFFNDLYHNFLNSYESLTQEQISTIAGLSGGAVSVESLNTARINKLKKVIEDADKVSISASNSRNPMAKTAASAKLQDRDLLKSVSVIPINATDEEKVRMAEEIELANRRVAEQEKLAASAAEAAKNAEIAAGEMQAKFDKIAQELREQEEKLTAEKAATAAAKANKDAEDAKAKYDEEVERIAKAADEKSKAEAIAAANKATAALNAALAEKEKLEIELQKALNPIIPEAKIPDYMYDKDYTGSNPYLLTPPIYMPPIKPPANIPPVVSEEKEGKDGTLKIALGIAAVGIVAWIASRDK